MENIISDLTDGILEAKDMGKISTDKIYIEGKNREMVSVFSSAIHYELGVSVSTSDKREGFYSINLDSYFNGIN